VLFPTAAFPICEERGVEVAGVVDGKEEDDDEEAGNVGLLGCCIDG
jgi:hypothetical protein